ncbi:MAG: hypothetical protein KQJ78_02800 [Deltaproteobacteria bacterium]|nr:hypothetical protein [Deltaproteobacteria bacterium]
MSTASPTKSFSNNLSDFVGIFLLAMSTLLYEVTLTRIFSFVVWSNYAFLIVSTALFGFGLAGVVLSLQKSGSSLLRADRVPWYSILFAILAVASLVVIIEVPLVVGEFNKIENWFSLLAVFVALVAPFFFAGLAISLLLSAEETRVHKLYFFDLAGAALGSIMLVFIITPLGASGAVVMAGGLGLLAAVVFAWRQPGLVKWVALLGVAGSLILTPYAGDVFVIEAHQAKRWFKSEDLTTLFSGWSTLSRVDVVSFEQGRRRNIFINGGENESYLASWDRERPLPPIWAESVNFPYVFISGKDKKPDIAIIGSSGGVEVAYALSHGAGNIYAVEMDPLICKVVSQTFADWNDHMFELPQVHLINDEGRSFIVNTEHNYDLIQMRNNFTPIAFASGAINLSETYLLTVEAFQDYMTKLKPGGILALHRWGVVRLCAIARQAAAELGLPDISRHVLIMSGEGLMMNGFYFQKTPFTDDQIEMAHAYAKTRRYQVLYDPHQGPEDSLYAAILKSPDPDTYRHYAGFNLKAPTDDRPFFDHFLLLGFQQDLNAPLLPQELKEIGGLLGWRPKGLLGSLLGGRMIPVSEIPLIAITIEATLVSILGMFLPLIFFSRGRQAGLRRWAVLSYFAILGMAFIMIELCYIKHYILFLGNPAMSISLIIAFLLLFTSAGSFFSERFGQNPGRALKLVFPAIFVVNAISIVVTPYVFQMFLGSPLMERIFICMLMVAPMGLVMGMPFPLGLRMLHHIAPQYIGWAWGVNGFMTVMGSILTVVVSLYFGFNAVLWMAGALYLCGLAVSRFAVK